MPQPRVTVTALKALTYEDRDYRAGESFKARAIDAASLSYQRQVSLTRPTRTLETRALTPELQHPEPAPRRRARKTAAEDGSPSTRTYQRRDLVAESPTE